MKRKRETEMACSEIRSAIDELSVMPIKTSKSDPLSKVQVPIMPFLSICNFLVQILDKIGPTMAVLRQDIDQNIKRLEKFHELNPLIYWDVVEILKKEADEGKPKKGPTCSKAFVWLTRSLDFALALLQLLAKDLERNMELAVEEAYTATLKPWHGWISTTAYKVALKLVPDNQSFIDILKTKDEDCDILKEELEKLISLLVPLLEQNNAILKTYGLDKLKST